MFVVFDILQKMFFRIFVSIFGNIYLMITITVTIAVAVTITLISCRIVRISIIGVNVDFYTTRK